MSIKHRICRMVFLLLPALFLAGGCSLTKDIKHLAATLRSISRESSAATDGIIIPSGREAFTQQQFHQISLKFHRRLIVQTYQERGLKDPSWDKPARALLEKYAECRANLADVAELTPLIQPLLKSGCQDPMVCYAIGVALMNNNQLAEAQPFVEQAVTGFKSGPYARVLVWSAPLRLADIYSTRRVQINQIDVNESLAVSWLADGADKDNFGPREAPVFWDAVAWRLNGHLGKRLPEICQQLQARPNADPWLVNLIGGRNEIEEAWKARGDDWADKVTEEGWKGFFEHLAKARKLLTAAWQLHPDYPEPAGEMITVVMGERYPKDSIVDWFNRAVAAQMDFEPAYDRLAWALAPRWGGSQKAMYQFGLDCLATKRFDTPVPLWYYHMVRRIANDDTGGDPEIWRRPEVYDQLVTLCQGMLSDPTRAGQQDELKSFWAVLAWRCGKYQEARSIIDDLGPKFQKKQFKSKFKVAPQKALNEIYAATGGAPAR